MDGPLALVHPIGFNRVYGVCCSAQTAHNLLLTVLTCIHTVHKDAICQFPVRWIVVNPQERKQTKRTSVQWLEIQTQKLYESQN